VSLLEFAKRLLASELQPASIFLTTRLFGALMESKPATDALLIRFVDNEAAVDHQVSWMKRAADDRLELTSLPGDQSDALWRQVADIDRSAAAACRISVPVSTVEAVIAKLGTRGHAAAVDLGVGIIRIAFDEDENKIAETINQMRSWAGESGGTLFVERASAAVRREVDAWGDAGRAWRLMKSVKAKFDHEVILNPGRFAAGI
jgi:FAD/FMN-containing dehydrogenase